MAKAGAAAYLNAMWYLTLKALISGIIVAAVSELSKRLPGIGGLLASLPLVAILSMIWLWRDKGDSQSVAKLSASTFWYVLPSLPMFLVIPALLNRGWTFGSSLAVGCVLTMALYALLAWLGPRFGIPV